MKTLSLMISAGVLLVVLGLVLAIGATIQGDVKDLSGDYTTLTVTNQTFTTDGNPTDLQTSGDIDSPAAASVTTCTNSSGLNETLTSGNWTLNSDTGSINFTVAANDDGGDGVEFLGNDFSCTYSGRETYGIVWGVGVNSSASLLELAGWQETIATVVAAVVILGLLFAGFGAYIYFKN